MAEKRLFELTCKEFEIFTTQTIEDVFSKYMPELLNRLSAHEDFTTTGHVCTELKISRQTLHNWLRNPNQNKILKPYINKQGGKYLFNLQGVKNAIKQNPLQFGKNRDYDYKFESVASEKEKMEKKYLDIKSKVLFGKEITSEEKVFYLQECGKRGDKIWLKDY